MKPLSGGNEFIKKHNISILHESFIKCYIMLKYNQNFLPVMRTQKELVESLNFLGTVKTGSALIFHFSYASSTLPFAISHLHT